MTLLASALAQVDDVGHELDPEAVVSLLVDAAERIDTDLEALASRLSYAYDSSSRATLRDLASEVADVLAVCAHLTRRATA